MYSSLISNINDEQFWLSLPHPYIWTVYLDSAINILLFLWLAKGMLKKRLPFDQMVSGYLEGLFDVIWEHVIIFHGSQSFVGGKGPSPSLFLTSHFKHAAENLKYVVPVIVTIDFVLLNIWQDIRYFMFHFLSLIIKKCCACS